MYNVHLMDSIYIKLAGYNIKGFHQSSSLFLISCNNLSDLIHNAINSDFASLLPGDARTLNNIKNV